MLFFLVFLNLAISAFNAWSCGRSWATTKHLGGLAHFMNWMGAIMSACGFTWCYTIMLAFGAHELHKLNDAYFQGALELGYVVVIFPILGSGLAITLEAVVYAWRRRTLSSMGIAAWDVFAQAHNMYQAITMLPDVFSHLGKLFDAADDEKPMVKLMVAIVVLALCGGILTTCIIIRGTAQARAQAIKLEALFAKDAVES